MSERLIRAALRDTDLTAWRDVSQWSHTVAVHPRSNRLTPAERFPSFSHAKSRQSQTPGTCDYPGSTGPRSNGEGNESNRLSPRALSFPQPRTLQTGEASDWGVSGMPCSARSGGAGEERGSTGSKWQQLSRWYCSSHDGMGQKVQPVPVLVIHFSLFPTFRDLQNPR